MVRYIESFAAGLVIKFASSSGNNTPQPYDRWLFRNLNGTWHKIKLYIRCFNDFLMSLVSTDTIDYKPSFTYSREL